MKGKMGSLTFMEEGNDEIDFSGIDEDLEQFQQDDIVRQALREGVDLRGYARDIDLELREVFSVSYKIMLVVVVWLAGQDVKFQKNVTPKWVNTFLQRRRHPATNLYFVLSSAVAPSMSCRVKSAW